MMTKKTPTAVARRTAHAQTMGRPTDHDGPGPPTRSHRRALRAGCAALAAAGLAALALAGPAAADPVGSVTEYTLPVGTGPSDIAAGPDGNLWFADYLRDGVGSIDPQTRTVNVYSTPTKHSYPSGIALGPDGNLWFTESNINKIGKIEPETGKITEFTTPTPDSFPQKITAGPDGDLWFTEHGVNKIGQFDPDTEEFTEYPIPAAGLPWGIAAGPDGDIWFTQDGLAGGDGQVGRFDLATKTFSGYTIPTPNSSPHGIAVGPDGGLWFAEYGANRIGRIDPQTFEFSEHVIPTPRSGPWGIAAGPDGDLWFTEYNNTEQIGRINATTGAFNEFPLPRPMWGSNPQGIALGPDGNMWFTQIGTNQIGRAITGPWPAPPPPPPSSGSGSGSGSCSPLAVTAVSPPAGQGGDTVTVSGSGFACATGVLFGDTPALGFTIDGPGRITARVPLLDPGTVDVRVLIGDQISPQDPAAVFTEPSVPDLAGPSPADDASATAPPHIAEICRVPDLHGRTVNGARQRLKKAHCRLGKIHRTTARRGAPTPRVITQMPSPHTWQPAGRRIDITIRTHR